MDQIYIWIIILFIVILYLDYCEKYYKKEDFTNNNSNDNKISYFEENKLTTSIPVNTLSALNINNKNLNFKNFSTDSITPPYLKCSTCKLDFNCADFPYEVDDKHKNVCHKCNEKLCNNNYNFPIYAKEAGRPRVCRNLK